MVTVYEAAIIANKNPETIRRWIRNGKLRGTISSKKEGYLIDEEALTYYLNKKDSPKHIDSVLQSDRYSRLSDLYKLRAFYEQLIEAIDQEIQQLGG